MTGQAVSPYYPSSRRFRNPLYLRVEEVPGAERLAAQLEPLAAAGRALDADRRIDRDAVFRLKQQALETLWAAFTGDPAFDDYCLASAALQQFAVYCALVKQYGAELASVAARVSHARRPGGPRLRRGSTRPRSAITNGCNGSWTCNWPVAAAVLPIVQDLPVGFDPGGADAWVWQDLLAGECTIGAPPDAFNAQGQDWQLSPFVPEKLRAAAYEPFIQTIRAALRHAAGLRINHVMGLFRLYWIPRGLSAAQGTYVRYPADDLMGIVALESHRPGHSLSAKTWARLSRASASGLPGKHPLRPPAVVRVAPAGRVSAPGAGHGDDPRSAHHCRAVERR